MPKRDYVQLSIITASCGNYEGVKGYNDKDSLTSHLTNCHEFDVKRVILDLLCCFVAIRMENRPSTTIRVSNKTVMSGIGRD
jgi:hypothetical protein